MKKKILVQFGAGNIGRSFIGRVFGTNGYEAVFVDINNAVIDTLNKEGKYTVVIKKNSVPDRLIEVPNARGVHSQNLEEVINLVKKADIIATSVGKNVLPIIASTIAAGLIERLKAYPGKPINIILAENLHNGAEFFKNALNPHLPGDFPLETYVGVIETSIGKMVPIMPLEVVKENPTIVYSEEYNNLILDKKAFIGDIPDIPEIKAVDSIAAYVDRKLCIHNLGHAAVSYFGNEAMPNAVYLYEVLADKKIFNHVQAAMMQSAATLLKEYPGVFTNASLQEHIEDLLERFMNKALGDTIFRVGRDLPRKLYRDDRVLGAAKLCIRHELPYDAIIDVFHAGLRFQAKDESGLLFPEDERLLEAVAEKGREWVLLNICKLNPEDPADNVLIKEIKKLQ
ncbi:MAG: mannitol-1-phosphate 5-dehydrogenase [Bacteroidetes bacterium]|nr:mannitol-1-phosphate 5-dehydrogenase [Bacteroidota bacterium]